jgi:hypothetical protein
MKKAEEYFHYYTQSYKDWKLKRLGRKKEYPLKRQ